MLNNLFRYCIYDVFFFFLLFLIIIIIANRDLSGMSTELFCCSKCRPSPDQMIVALPFLHRYQLLCSFHILPLHFSHHVSLSEFYKDLKWDISRFQLTPVPDKNLCWQSQRKGDGAIFSKRKSSDSKQKWWCDQFQKISRFAAAGFGEQEHHLRRSGWKLRSADFTAKNQVNKSWNFFVHIAQVSLAPSPVSP